MASPASVKLPSTPSNLRSKLLHGSDIPKQFDGILVRVKAIRDAPSNFKSPYIIDFAEPYPYGCGSWAVNLSNAQLIADKLGDDVNAINGKRVYLRKVRANNPQTEEEVWSLLIGKIEGEKAPIVDAAPKAKKVNAKAPKTTEGIKEADLPF